MSENININEVVNNESNRILVPRKKGRPKVVADKKEYKKEYTKQYTKKIIEEKGEVYERLKNNIGKYNERCRKSYQILKKMYEDKEQNIKPEYMEEIIKLFNTVVTVQSTE